MRIFLRRRGQISGDAACQQFGKSTDRRQRCAEFIAHIGEEAGHHCICLFERTVAFTQGLFGLTRGGDIEDSEHAIAVGKRYTGKIERSPIGQFDPAIAFLAIQRCGADHLVDARNSRWVGQILGDGIQKVFGLWMAIQGFRIDTPGAGEPAVPQFQMSVRSENRERFEQAVEGGGSGAQQGIARCRQGQLLRPVFGNHHETAIRQRLGDDPKVGAVG